MERNVLVVGVGEIAVVEGPSLLVAMALGSCVAVMMYDAKVGVAGLAHVMLPSAPSIETPHCGRYADTAVEALAGELVSRGARRGLLLAKLAGGAQMFSMNSDIGAIGTRNTEALVSLLKDRHIALVAQDTGGRRARTVEFDTETGVATVRMACEIERRL